jgi:hypothetical protein
MEIDRKIERATHPFVRLKPGNGIVVASIKTKTGNTIPVYGPYRVKTGKRYIDSGYPGSVRRRMEREV